MDDLYMDDLYLAACWKYLKIGRARNPWSRVREIQCGSPIPITLLAVFKGAGYMERELHAHYQHLQAHREWYRICPLDGNKLREICSLLYWYPVTWCEAPLLEAPE